MNEFDATSLRSLRQGFGILAVGYSLFLAHDLLGSEAGGFRYAALVTLPYLFVSALSVLQRASLSRWMGYVAWCLGGSLVVHLTFSLRGAVPQDIGYEAIFSATGITLLVGSYVSDPTSTKKADDGSAGEGA